MAFKFVIISCLVALVHSGAVPVAVPAAPVIAGPVVAARLEEFDSPQYRFGYGVADANTGDFKSQTEQRDGATVSGQYSFVQPDGTRRVVDYTADDVEGFRAVVRNEPLVAPAPAVVAEPVLPARLAAPVVPAAYAPARYTAPAAPLTYSSPALAAYTAPFAQYAAAPVAYAPAAARYVAF